AFAHLVFRLGWSFEKESGSLNRVREGLLVAEVSPRIGPGSGSNFGRSFGPASGPLGEQTGERFAVVRDGEFRPCCLHHPVLGAAPKPPLRFPSPLPQP